MAKYSYRAKDSKGRQQTGLAEAATETEVADILKERHLIPTQISLYKGSWDINEILEKLSGVSIGDKASFTRQMATMIAAGLPLTEALNILQNQVSSSLLKKILQEALHEVESGEQLSVAFARHPEIFPQIYIALLRAGEASGSMDKTLMRLADQMEQERDFRSKIKGALLYPIIISCAMVVIATAMMILVIPKIAGVYDEFHADLPLPTQILIVMSRLTQQYIYFAPVVLAAAYFGFVRLRKTPAGGKFLSNMSFHIPVFGELNKMVTYAIMVKTFGSLVGSGIPILEALRITTDTVGNNLYGDALREASVQVEKGVRLSIPIQSNKNFAPIIGQMIAIGEETGQLDDVLAKLAVYFEEESNQRIKNLTTALEPIMIMIMGVGVAGLALAVLLPLFNLVNVIK